MYAIILLFQHLRHFQLHEPADRISATGASLRGTVSRDGVPIMKGMRGDKHSVGKRYKDTARTPQGHKKPGSVLTAPLLMHTVKRVRGKYLKIPSDFCTARVADHIDSR